MKWAMELSEFDISYKPRPAIKAQALADFVMELTPQAAPGTEANNLPQWVLHVDGSTTNSHSGAGLVLKGPDGFVTQYALRFEFRASNNEAEYEALLTGLKLAQKMGAQNLLVHSDSQLVVNQVKGEYVALGPRMVKYLEKVKDLAGTFQKFKITQIPRADNTEADSLARLASSEGLDLKRSIYLESLPRPSIEEAQPVCPIDQTASWMTPIFAYLRDGTLPEDRKEARKLKQRALRFAIIGDTLFKRSFTLPYLRCLSLSEASEVLDEIHSGECGSHIGARTLAYKALRTGYFWPKMRQDAVDLVQRCPKCQAHQTVPHAPATKYQPITGPWPFARWGVDIMGPFHTAAGNVKHLILAIDYFTKWVEGRALASTTSSRIKSFLWQDIVCRYGVPRAIITDGGSNFDNRELDEFCEEHNIEHRLISVYNPQSNGQIEVTNRTIKDGLKKRLDEAKGNWVEELPNVLWSYRTTPSSTTRETPFSLAFGAEAMIPVELAIPSLRAQSYLPAENEELQRMELDLVQERRDNAQLRVAAYHQQVAKYYDSRVRGRELKVGQLALRKIEKETLKKLDSKWEGPYRVVQVVKPGTYRLETLGGRPIRRTWNIRKLRIFYK